MEMAFGVIDLSDEVKSKIAGLENDWKTGGGNEFGETIYLILKKLEDLEKRIKDLEKDFTFHKHNR